jgi:hypothetical protein
MNICKQINIGAFKDWKHGQNALHDLLHNGFAREQLGIMARGGENWIWDSNQPLQDDRTAEQPGFDQPNGDAHDLWVVGIAAGELSDVGPTIAGGALTSVLERKNGVLNELTRRGMAEQDARYYEDQLRSGLTLVIADDRARSEEAADIMQRRGGQVRA